MPRRMLRQATVRHVTARRAAQWTVGAQDPALYRDILTATVRPPS
jgi:hypothetical protein